MIHKWPIWDLINDSYFWVLLFFFVFSGIIFVWAGRREWVRRRERGRSSSRAQPCYLNFLSLLPFPVQRSSIYRSRCRERMEAHYYFGESAPIGRPSGSFVPRTTTRPKHGRRRHLDHSVPCRRISVPSMIMLLWLVSRAVLHTANFMNLCDIPVSTSIRPIACDIQDLCQRIPSTALCLGKRAIGNPLLPSSIPPRNHRAMIIFTLLILCGDVECNPGPHCETIYPCGLCDRKVDWGVKGIACDSCNMWYHCSCISMQSTEYERLDSTSAEWKCFRCDFSFPDNSLYHSYNVEVSNSFSLLAGPMFNDSVFSNASLSPQFLPQSHSSPLPPGGNLPAQSRTSNNSKASAGARRDPSETTSHTSLPHKAKNMRFLSINCNSICSKKAELEKLVSYTSPDVLFLCETKIDDKISNSEFIPPGYKGFRKDRNRDGGGVMVMVKDCYQATSVPMEDVSGEVCWVKVETDDNPLYVGSFYRTPSDKSTYQLDELEKSLHNINSITRNNPNATVIVAGDFNLGDVDWDSGIVPPGARDKSNSEKLLDILCSNNLEQQNMSHTRESRILDLFCTNKPGLTKSVNVIPGLSDHEIVCADCNIKARITKKPPRKIHLWSKADWQSLRTKLCEFRDDFISSCHLRSVEENYSKFKNEIESLMTKYIPSKMTSTRFNMPWFNNTIKRMCKKKQRLFNKAKRTKLNRHWQQYRAFKKDVLKSIRKQRWKYINDILQVSLEQGDSKPFWSYIRAQRQDNSGVSPLLKQGVLHTDNLSKAKILNDQFSSVFTQEDTTDIPHLHNPAYKDISELHISQEGVEKLLRNVKASKASGPDRVPCRFLTELAPELAPILTKIFQQSLKDGVLPSDWKKADVAPVFKKGAKDLAENYRPVSLTCVCCKILEHIISSHIRQHLDQHKILSKLQHGFRKFFSCEHNYLWLSRTSFRSETKISKLTWPY